MKPEPVKDMKGKLVELDMEKAGQGLGDIYEKDYLNTVNVDVIDEKIQNFRNEAKKLFKTVIIKF